MSEMAEWCRKKMTECERLAMATSDDAFRQMYLDTAQQWRELAEHIEAGQEHIDGPISVH
jgi:hypothetical protein